MTPRGPEFEHTLGNQVAIVIGYIELLLDEVPSGSRMRADLVEMHKAALMALNLLRDAEPGS